MRHPEYAKYKNSGVEWLGVLPDHWEVTRLANLFTEVDERGNDDLPVLSVSIHDGVSDAELDDSESERKVTRSDDRSKYKRVAPGDLVYNMMRAWQGGFGTVTVEGMVSPAYVVARPVGNLPTAYIEQLLRTANAVEEMRRHSRGVTDFRLRLYWDEFKNIVVSKPSPKEQELILAFLACEIAKIDTLVEEQRRLIELLKEKRQAVISQAVTKGLNSNVPMKDSGVEWLGKIPAHWQLVKVKYLCSRISSGKTPSGGSETYVDEGVTFLRSQNVHDDGLQLEDVVYIDDRTDAAMASSRALAGDILLNITGASIGRTCQVPKPFPPANVNQHVCVLRSRDASLAEFLAWFLKSSLAKMYMAYIQNGAARDGLNFEQIGNLLLALPTLQERALIAIRLSQQYLQFGELIGRAEESIALLHERRSALISAAVTGKIDVRGLVPQPEVVVA